MASKYLTSDLKIKFRNALGDDCTPNATCFHWKFPYGQVKALFGPESGCIKILRYPDLMLSMVKYFVSFNLDQI